MNNAEGEAAAAGPGDREVVAGIYWIFLKAVPARDRCPASQTVRCVDRDS